MSKMYLHDVSLIQPDKSRLVETTATKKPSVGSVGDLSVGDIYLRVMGDNQIS
jgi:hypothetical protein